MKAQAVMLVGAVLLVAGLLSSLDTFGIIGHAKMMDVAVWDSAAKKVVIDFSHENKVGLADCEGAVGFSLSSYGVRGAGEATCRDYLQGGWSRAKQTCSFSSVTPTISGGWKCLVDYDNSYVVVEGDRLPLVSASPPTFEQKCESGSDNFRYVTHQYHLEVLCDAEELERLWELQLEEWRQNRRDREAEEFPFQDDIDGYTKPDNAPVTYVYVKEKAFSWPVAAGALIVFVGIIMLFSRGGRNR